MTSSGTGSGSGSVPAPRRAHAPSRTVLDELLLLAQAVDVLSVRVAIAGGLATGVRARALGLHLATASAALRDNCAVQQSVVLPVLGPEDDAAVVQLHAGIERVLTAAQAVTTGAAHLLGQTAGVRTLQDLGIATRTLWAAAVEHDHAWSELAAPRARQLMLARRRKAVR